MLREAQDLLDGQMDRAHVVELLYLRQRSVLLRGDAEAYLATTWRVVQHFDVRMRRAEAGTYRFETAIKASARRRLEGMLGELSGAQFAVVAGADELGARLRALLRALDAG